MRILLLGPTHISFIQEFLHPKQHGESLPAGYEGAPFMGTLIRAYLNKGHEVISVTTSVSINDDYTIKKFSNHKFTWIVVPERKHAFSMNKNKPGRMVDFFQFERKRMLQVIEEHNPDIVHAHWSYEFAAAAIASGKPYLITVHDHHWKVLFYLRDLYRLFRTIWAELNVIRAKNLVTVSPYIANFLKKRNKNVLIISNPIKISFTEKSVRCLVEERVNAIANPQIIMILNYWKGRKNGYFGLHVLQQIAKKIPNVTMHLVGIETEIGGPAYQDAKQLNVLPNTVFHGVLPNRELMALLSTMHVLLHPAKEESFGVVLGEAASLGIPCFGYHKAGAVPWVIRDEELLFKQWDAEEVANAIIALLSNQIYYVEKAMKCYEKVCNNFSADAVVQAYEAVYRKIAL